MQIIYNIKDLLSGMIIFHYYFEKNIINFDNKENFVNFVADMNLKNQLFQYSQMRHLGVTETVKMPEAQGFYPIVEKIGRIFNERFEILFDSEIIEKIEKLLEETDFWDTLKNEMMKLAR